ncbi:uncharacterized protein Gasu_18590 [Galdieria sulphuraria]|uniref:Fe2OG dioxygenase domain-containing protein n=1 Tax=Galdieria sulphuraria TaxID=130081 RepID=M2Y4I5_GALSU|nr:uncharacterized protein Gasu_18590 [Galdieria sulphuraria]EME30843.1 hypothetical protein Gasu_18590 [Galdieria sulphuraria]|eukprot:XP_005707363.1 hypothetical protein Gasu_18590 [Galdieria sulphuraria]
MFLISKVNDSVHSQNKSHNSLKQIFLLPLSDERDSNHFQVEGTTSFETDVIRMSAIEVHSVPGLVYISEYIDTQLEEYLLTQIYRQPVVKWKVLANRRLQNWGGTPHSKGMIATTLPTWLLCIATRLEKDGFFPETPNHVLINEYLPGQGIEPHEDGPIYYPCAAILSLENEIVLDFYSKGVNSVTAEEIQQYTGSLLLEPRSLLIIRDSAYQNYLHGIQESFYIKKSSWLLNYCCDGEGEQVARKKRVSLTVRLVPKTVHNVVRLGK